MDARPPLFDETTAAGRLMAATDWSATPVGDPAQWPQTLRVLVPTILGSRYPMLLLWGEDFTQLYNDAYSGLIGDRHPAAMGNDCRVTLAEAWPTLGPLIAEAMETGVASWVPALQLLLDRSGYREEAYFSVSHAPVHDDDGVTRGVLTVCSEVTEQVVGERRLRLLQELALADDGSLSVADVAARLVAAVEAYALDVPFVGLYLREGPVLQRAAGSEVGLPAEVRVEGRRRDDQWGLVSAASGTAVSVTVPDGVAVAGGPWGDPVTRAIALPVPSADRHAPLGVVLVGISPSRALDPMYRSFLDLLVQQVGVAVRNARSHEEERARAQALAELDRVKTDFFTNVSHEFRTPLTLMLGPLADALADRQEPLVAGQRERVETALRASRRLLKLVNNLLTFSSVEAGSATSTARPVDLAALTTDLASSFRAAVERGGLALEVDCPPLPRPVAVDAEHWETVVTNLLSNALKFTFAGRIVVRLDSDDVGLRLEVADTGVGIPAEELPRLFDRFHRVRDARSRSHEGSGVGLALVRELAALLGGTVEVSSEVGVGSAFHLRLPWRAVDPTRAVAPAGSASEGGDDGLLSAAVEEAESWTTVAAADEPAVAARRAGRTTEPTEPTDPTDPAGPAVPAVGEPVEARVLVADDNADMRDHVVRLLQAQGWDVVAVPDGREALELALQDPPDLLLTDVMMPGLDGFELLRRLRADARTATLPVVVLSARAGPGASVEGLELGADDYVVKPFRSEDLVARLRSTMRLARQRTRHVAQLRQLADAAALITSGRRLDDAVATLTDQTRALLGAREVAVTLEGSDDDRSVTYRSVAEGGDGSDGGGSAAAGGGTHEELAVAVRGRGDRRLGELRAHLAVADSLRPQTRALLEPVARVLAAVVEEGWHTERDAAVAGTLQRVLLPDRLPETPGLALAAAYRPAERSVQVGGDWYDVLELPDGRLALSVGDVAGQGLTSALVMGQLRTAVRAYALEGLGPAATVTALDELVERMAGPTFTTLFLGYLDPGTGRLDWCNAGHPPPAVLPAEGPAEWLEGPVTLPLGASFGTPAQQTASTLPAGSRLVLYTDGLVEDREHQLDVGMPALHRRLEAGRRQEPGVLAEALLGDGGSEQADDVAVLVVHREAGTSGRSLALSDLALELTLPRVPSAASRVRRRLYPALLAAGLDEETVFELLLGLSEAVNNAVEHAVDPSRDEVVVRVQVAAAERTARLEVQDFGQWRERQPSMDRGHGATLMTASGRVQVVPSASGTLVVVERDL